MKKKELKGIVICLKCGARGVRKHIFSIKRIVKCPCGNELRAYRKREV